MSFRNTGPTVDALSASRSRSVETSRLTEVILPILIILLAVVAGALHLAHNYLPMDVPSDASGSPPSGAPPAGAAGGGGGLMDLISPYLTQIFILNFVAFVVLALLFFVAMRRRSDWRIGVDVLLVVLCAMTLYAWNTLGRSNPKETGTIALVVELVLIVFAVTDAFLLGFRRSRNGFDSSRVVRAK